MDLGYVRRIGQYGGHTPGPTVALLGGMHGNEPAGVLAIRQVLSVLHEERIPLRGKVVGLAGNLKALRAGTRYLDTDLNRMWRQPELDRMLCGDLAECEELRELKQELDAIAAPQGEPVNFVDFHSFSGEGPPFVITDDLSKHPRFFDGLPMPIIIGLSPKLPGTLVNYLSRQGHKAMAVEGGQHNDPVTVLNLAFFTWLMLLKKGLIAQEHAPSTIESTWDRLESLTGHLPSVVEINYRHRIGADDAFEMQPGFRSFDPVGEGQPLARDRRGVVYAPSAGCILMPLYQGQGSDGFFLGQPLRV